MAGPVLPKYRRIAETLAGELRTRRTRTTALASESELVARFSVSRITIRQALAILEHQGLIHRAQGRRTVAAPPKLVRHLHPLVTLEEDLAQQRVDLETEVLEFRQTQPASWARERLGGGARALRLVLKRVVDGRCVCCDERYVVQDVADALTPAAVASESTREALRKKLGLLLTHLDHETEVVPVDATIAAAMGLVPGTPVMQNTYTSFAEGRPVEVGCASYRVDRFRFAFGQRQWR